MFVRGLWTKVLAQITKAFVATFVYVCWCTLVVIFITTRLHRLLTWASNTTGEVGEYSLVVKRFCSSLKGNHNLHK